MHVKNWNRMQNAADLGGGGVFYQCEEYACMLHIISLRAHFSQKIVSEYDKEIPQSQTADRPMAPRGRATQQSRDTRKTNQAKQPALSFPSR